MVFGMKKPETKTIATRVDKPTAAKIEKHADDQGRTISNWLRVLILKAIKS